MDTCFIVGLAYTIVAIASRQDSLQGMTLTFAMMEALKLRRYTIANHLFAVVVERKFKCLKLKFGILNMLA